MWLAYYIALLALLEFVASIYSTQNPILYSRLL